MTTVSTHNPSRPNTPPWHGLALLVLAAAALGCGASMPKSVTSWRSTMKVVTTADGHRLQYVDVGPRSGEAILLLHGLPTNSSLYREVIPLLTKQGYRVIAPDLVGYGASSKPKHASDYAPGLQGDRILALLQELGTEKVSMVVHDLGGIVGWEVLSKKPSQVERILVLNTTAYFEGFRPPMEMRLLAGPMGSAMGGMMSSASMGRTLMGDFLKENTGDGDNVDAAMIDNIWWAMQEGSNVPMRTMANTFLDLSKSFPRYQAALRAFEGPAALLWGGRDVVLTFASIGKLFAEDLHIPKERQQLLPKAGHFLMLDEPVATAEAILGLMKVATNAGQGAHAAAAPSRATSFSSPPPGPSASVALDIADRGLVDADKHDIRGGTRWRLLWGGGPAYAAGFDASIGHASGFSYRAAAYPLGIGLAGAGSQVSLVGGVGVHDIADSGPRFEAPIAVDAAWQLGAVRALAWGHAAWTSEGFDALRWEGALGLRIGSSNVYFPNATKGSGPYLAAVASGQGAERAFGLALGFELGDGR